MALTADEQYMLELLNRARLDPVGEAQRYGLTDLNKDLPPGTISGLPLPVLAYDYQLDAAAESHSQWMVDNDTFSHTGAGGSSSRQRMQQSGYQFTGSGHSAENIALYGTTGSLNAGEAIEQEHKDLFLSAGHRDNILTADFSKVGLAQVIGKYSQNGSTFNASLITQDFGSSADVFVTGVIYNDSNGNAFYTQGEGVAGTPIQIAGGAATTSASAGGYTVVAPKGQAQVQIGGASVLVSTLAGNAKIDLVGGSLIKASADVTLLSGVNRATLLGVGNINATGSAGDDTLTGNAGNNRLEGGAGFDVLTGGLGDDVYVDPVGDNVVEKPGEGSDTIFSSTSYALGAIANVENLRLIGSANADARGDGGANIVAGNGGANTITGGGGNDTLDGGAGVDTVSYADEVTPVTVDLSVAGPQTTGDAGTDTLTNFENVTGGSAGDVLKGNGGNNVLDGRDGADTLIGAGGNDTLIGGSGEDFYLADGVVKIVEAADGGFDKVQTSSSIVLDPNVEDVVLTGLGDIDATGNDGANRITGNDGANVLDGRGGTDTLAGGRGNDTYVNPGADVVVEDVDGGTDTVQSDASVSLAGFANVENVVLTGVANVNATGSGEANKLTGNGGNNTLDGAGGADTMVGGFGNDIYRVDNAGDQIVEATGQGTDTAFTAVSFVLSNILSIETLAAADPNGLEGLALTGNDFAQVLKGNNGSNTLDGAGGADTLVGLGGNDLYRVDNAGDRILEADGQGDDRVLAAVSFVLNGGQFVEHVETTDAAARAAINLTGNEFGQSITGNAGANILDGRAGADTLVGLGGDDTYRIDRATDIVVEAANAGSDTVLASTSYALAVRQSIEVLATDNAVSQTAINLSGNELAQRVVGNAGANTLRGGDGNDTLEGGAGADVLMGEAGDDTYLNPDAADRISEAADGGTDTVLSNSTFSLAGMGAVERLVLTGSGVIDGSGNGFANEIVGNAKANTLTGGSGNDTLTGGDGADRLIGGADTDLMRGGAGNDVYVDPAGDRIIEQAGEGTDTIESSKTFNMARADNVERLTLTGTARANAGGNALDNWLVGNVAANTLNGAAGADTLDGADGDDRMDGGAGADLMRGGNGNDTYVNPVLTEGDRIVEAANGGVADAIESNTSFSLASLSTIENLVLTGTLDLNGTGNDANNSIRGTAGANALVGGAGDDTLLGGAGNDTLTGGLGNDDMRGGTGDDTYVDPILENGERIIESAGAANGNDLVLSRSTISLASALYVERLTLIGSGNIDGTGNTSANEITGNSGRNSLAGASGNDSLFGGAGRDTLNGGRGNDLMDGGSEPDLFRFSSSEDGNDRIVGFDTVRDRFELARGLFTAERESDTGTLLFHKGGTILIEGVTGLTLAEWNALVVPPAAAAATAAMVQGEAASPDAATGAFRFSPDAPDELLVFQPADLMSVTQADFLAY